jgi:hypothetical protein
VPASAAHLAFVLDEDSLLLIHHTLQFAGSMPTAGAFLVYIDNLINCRRRGRDQKLEQEDEDTLQIYPDHGNLFRISQRIQKKKIRSSIASPTINSQTIKTSLRRELPKRTAIRLR